MFFQIMQNETGSTIEGETQTAQAPEQAQPAAVVETNRSRVLNHIRRSGVISIIKENNRRVSDAFLIALDAKVEALVRQACAVESKKKTIDMDIGSQIGL